MLQRLQGKRTATKGKTLGGEEWAPAPGGDFFVCLLKSEDFPSAIDCESGTVRTFRGRFGSQITNLLSNQTAPPP